MERQPVREDGNSLGEEIVEVKGRNQCLGVGLSSMRLDVGLAGQY